MARFKLGDRVKTCAGKDEYFIAGVEYGSGKHEMPSTHQEDVHYLLSRSMHLKKPYLRVHGSQIELVRPRIPTEEASPCNMD